MSFILCVVLGAHSGDAMWMVRVDTSSFTVLKAEHRVSLLKMSSTNTFETL